MNTFFRKLYFRIFKQYKRLEIRFITYRDADILLKQNEGKPENEKWFLAKEEDDNRIIGYVYLERKERIIE